MSQPRIFRSAEHFQPSPGEPIRSVVTESADAVVVAWHVAPGQRVASHVHPHGQDTWTILAGTGAYVTDVAGATRRLGAGDVAVARKGDVHGVLNDGAEPLRFISVVCPADAGYALVAAGSS